MLKESNVMQKLDKSKLVMNLSKGYKLVPYLDKVFTDGFEDEWSFTYQEKEPDDAWHPSGHCTPPPRVLYAVAQGANSFGPISGSLRKSFHVGHYWHQLLQYIVLEKLEFCEPEAIERRGTRIWGELESDSPPLPQPFHWVTGSADIAPLVLPKLWQGIVDFKTMGSGMFKQGGIPFADKYECQINIYLDLFEEERALIVGINKDSPHDFKEWEFVRNQPLIDAIYDKWEYVSAALDGGVELTTKDDENWPALPLLGPVG